MNKPSYYHVWIAANQDQTFFKQSLDKAYFISLLQDQLSPRVHFQTHHPAPVDLMAYALTDFGVNLLVCSLDSTAVEMFGQNLLLAYSDYLNQQTSWEVLPFDTIFAHDRLRDIGEALRISREIHLLPDNWRQEFYSSLSFYLDDRRGDWLQAWRLADLYHNDSSWYLEYLFDDSENYSSAQEVRKLEFLET